MANLTVHEGLIDYADGGEQALLSIVSDPSFDENRTYRNHLNQWNIFYHLSPLRKNIFAWLDFPESISILELGAGCGALTAHLATIPQSRVVAVEGSVARAKVIAQRCRSLDNVDIHASNLINFSSDEKYDLVTLIGVLEYAGKFSNSETPFHDTLCRAQSHMKDNGTLAIAIENRMGHKYIAGIAEDHYGAAFEGINGYPHFNGIKTFDYSELTRLLSECGFTSIQFVFPFPDYKLPDLVVTEAGFKEERFDPLDLMGFPSADHVTKKQPLFNEQEILRSLHNQQVAHLFMNSFLVFASRCPDPKLMIDRNLLAVKLNGHRVHPFSTKVIFSRDESSLFISKERLGPSLANNDVWEGNGLRHQPGIDNGAYVPNAKSYEKLLVIALAHRHYHEALRILSSWISILVSAGSPAEEEDIAVFDEFCRIRFNRSLYTHAYSQLWVNGENIDLIPRNIIEDPTTHATKIIDREWSLLVRVPLQLVYDRALIHTQTAIAPLALNLPNQVSESYLFPREIVSNLPHQEIVQNHDRKSGMIFENWLQNIVIGEPRSSSKSGTGNSPNDVVSFINTIARLAEEGKLTDSLCYYQEGRNLFSAHHPDLARVDELMNNLIVKLQGKRGPDS